VPAAPANGAIVTLPVTLDWNDVANAASYQVQVDDSSSFSSPFVVNQTVTASQFTLSSAAARQHWWRVRGRNSAGTNGPWSPVRTFTPDAGGSPPPANPRTLTVTASGRSGERVTSSPAGINVTVGSSGSATFGSGTSITLSVSGGRDAVWSGACSSGGNKTKTCTLMLNADAAVTANVQ
jgi:opacity protein-like surface antigen